MRTVQMTIDEPLLAAVDRAVRRLRTTRSEFTRQALRGALEDVARRELEARQARGYRTRPVRRGEFSRWEAEQAWPD
jgi:metal-responsive CopG/Arc/MetJ family transcriptional regulator